MLDVKIDYMDIKRYSRVLANANNRIVVNQFQFIKKAVEVGANIMKREIRGRIRTNRSKGQLESSVTTGTKIIGKAVEGKISVGGRKAPYARAQEFGIRKRTIIRGHPVMAFPASSWRGARIPPNSKGYYVFYRVQRGKYKGKYYVRDTYKTLKGIIQSMLNSYVIPGVERIYMRKV